MAINVIMLQNNVYRNDPRQYVFQSKLRSRKELIRYFGDLTLESENNNNALNDLVLNTTLFNNFKLSIFVFFG